MAESLFKETGIEKLASTGVALTKKISFNKVKLENTICQSINASVSIQVSPYYEIGSRNLHRVAARTQGQGSLSNVMGPTAETLTALKVLCDVCNPDDLNVKFYNACSSSSGGGGGSALAGAAAGAAIGGVAAGLGGAAIGAAIGGALGAMMGGGAENGLRFKDCICTGITCDMQAAQDIINGQWTLMFSDVTTL